jgi:hypothetical protein
MTDFVVVRQPTGPVTSGYDFCSHFLQRSFSVYMQKGEPPDWETRLRAEM